MFRIHRPSLRERPGDIAGYIRVFAAQFAYKMGRRIDSIDADYIAALERHTWHGNVRELRNAVEALGGEIEQEREFYGDPDYEYLRNLE